MENLVQDPRLVATNNLRENNSVNSVVFQEHFPITAITPLSQSQVEFVIPANSNGLIDLKGSYIVNTLSGIREGGVPGVGVSPAWNQATDIGFKENLGDTLWKDVKIFINGVEVQDNHPNLYLQSAFYKRVLDDQGGNGTSVCFNSPRAESTATVSQTLDKALSRYSGWKGVESLNLAGDNEIGNQLTDAAELSALPSHRVYDIFRRSQASSSTEVITKLQDGIFNQPFFLPPNCDIRILLTKSNDAQCIYSNAITAPTAYANLTSSILYVKRAYPIPSAMEMFNRSLALAPLVYNIKYTRISQRTVSSGTSSIQETNLLNGVVPDRVLVAFLPTDAINGHYRMSPYISAPSSVGSTNPINNVITSIYINANGRQYPQRQYDMTSGFNTTTQTKCNGARAYMDYVNTWAEDNDVFPQDSPMITFDNWNSNYTFFVFDLRNDKLNENGYTTDLNNRGSIEVLATQSNSHASGIVGTTMLVMGITNAKIFIDANRNVSKEGF
tara:strand:+ start:692 stop:2191 length:1500 start_codon:yes stop_codon:yes gene_type:complete